MGKIKPDRGLVHIEVITSQSRTTNNPQRDTTSHPEVSSYIDVCDCVCHSPLSVEFASLESFLPLERQHAAHCLVRAVIDWAGLAVLSRPPLHTPARFICYTFIVHNPSALTSSHSVSFFTLLLYQGGSFFYMAVIDCLAPAVYNWPR